MKEPVGVGVEGKKGFDAVLRRSADTRRSESEISLQMADKRGRWEVLGPTRPVNVVTKAGGEKRSGTLNVIDGRHNIGRVLR